jgi:hypothetical protein
MGTKPLTPGDLQHIADKMRIAKGQEQIDHAKKEEQERHALREAFMTRDLHPEVMERVNTHARIDDPLRQWKLSPTDLESRRRWYDYSLARDQMLAAPFGQRANRSHAPGCVPASRAARPVNIALATAW